MGVGVGVSVAVAVEVGVRVGVGVFYGGRFVGVSGKIVGVFDGTTTATGVGVAGGTTPAIAIAPTATSPTITAPIMNLAAPLKPAGPADPSPLFGGIVGGINMSRLCCV